MQPRSLVRQAPLLLIVLIGGIAIAQSADGDGRDVPYLGHLEQDGVAVSGDVAMEGALFATLDAASACHTQLFDPVSVAAGRFHVTFEDVPDACFTSGQLWLQLSVGADALSLTLLANAGGNRMPLGAVPFAAGAPAGAPFIVDDQLEVRGGRITRGGPLDTAGDDLGLYSQVDGAYVRVVSNNAPIRFYADGGYGTTHRMSIEPSGNVSVTGNVQAGGTLSSGGNVDVGGNLKVRGTSFGVYSTYSFGEGHTAPTDGFVNAYIHADTNGDRCDITAVVDGVIFAAAAVHYFTNTDNHVKLNSLMMPVARGQSWSISRSDTSGTCAGAIRFTPLAP